MSNEVTKRLKPNFSDIAKWQADQTFVIRAEGNHKGWQWAVVERTAPSVLTASHSILLWIDISLFNDLLSLKDNSKESKIGRWLDKCPLIDVDFKKFGITDIFGEISGDYQSYWDTGYNECTFVKYELDHYTNPEIRLKTFIANDKVDVFTFSLEEFTKIAEYAIDQLEVWFDVLRVFKKFTKPGFDELDYIEEWED